MADIQRQGLMEQTISASDVLGILIQLKIDIKQYKDELKEYDVIELTQEFRSWPTQKRFTKTDLWSLVKDLSFVKKAMIVYRGISRETALDTLHLPDAEYLAVSHTFDVAIQCRIVAGVMEASFEDNGASAERYKEQM